MDEIFYCGFNGFKQVPSQPEKHTITSLVLQTPPKSSYNGRKIVDVAICWNYLVVVEPDSVTKYGLVQGKHGHERLCLPPSEKSGHITQLSATPRHLLAVTADGECWTHEEGKGWRQVHVGAERPDDLMTPDPSKISLIDLTTNSEEDPTKTGCDLQDSCEDRVHLIKTSCGDAYNIGMDKEGRAYSLPSPLEFDPFPSGIQHKVTDIACGKEHCLLLTEHGQVWSWGVGSRGQLGHGILGNEEKPRLVSALDGMKIKKIAAGGWHSAVISQFDDLYMFGWNESGQLAMPTNLAKPAECFSAVEKLLMACCTMQPEDAALPRGDAEGDGEVYHKNDDDSSIGGNLMGGGSIVDPVAFEAEKDALTCYKTAACNSDTDLVVVQTLPMLVSIPVPRGGSGDSESGALDVGCGSRHTVVLTKDNHLWAFGWNKYGQLGLGHTTSKDTVEKVALPKGFGRNSTVKMLRCGDWGTAVVVSNPTKKS